MKFNFSASPDTNVYGMLESINLDGMSHKSFRTSRDGSNTLVYRFVKKPVPHPISSIELFIEKEFSFQILNNLSAIFFCGKASIL